MRQKSELRAYQDRIATALYENDEKLCVVRPGGGKTIAALTAIEELIRDKVIRHALVIAPKRVARSVWPDEIEQWAHTQSLRYRRARRHAARARGRSELRAEDRDLTIIGIDLVPWLLDDLTKHPLDHPLFDLLVIDEVVQAARSHRQARQGAGPASPPLENDLGLERHAAPLGTARSVHAGPRRVTRGKLWGKSFYKWREKYFYPGRSLGLRVAAALRRRR